MSFRPDEVGPNGFGVACPVAETSLPRVTGTLSGNASLSFAPRARSRPSSEIRNHDNIIGYYAPRDGEPFAVRRIVEVEKLITLEVR